MRATSPRPRSRRPSGPPRSAPLLPIVAVCLLACRPPSATATARADAATADASASAEETVGAGRALCGDVEPAYLVHCDALAQRVPEGFTAVVTPPFVVLGDEAPAVVAQRADRLVRWATELLERDFFPKQPTRILDVWLFRDESSYLHHADALFGDTPDTPYGYYLPAHDALVMNIATGGGTLVHELVHPYVEANLPGCPTWIDEGLGSLFEACGERDGHIVGLLNWRLPVLQQAIRDGRVPRLATLAALEPSAFQGDGVDVHYAASRYLMYHLQQQGLLATFVREFGAHRGDDPTGYATFLRVAAIADVDGFQRDWESWILGLELPAR